MTLQVPWCLGRLPWAPGVPPRCSLGGGSRPNVCGSDIGKPSWFRIFDFSSPSKAQTVLGVPGGWLPDQDLETSFVILKFQNYWTHF